MQKQNALSLVNPLTNGRLATRLTYRTSVTLYLSYFQLTIHPYDFYGFYDRKEFLSFNLRCPDAEKTYKWRSGFSFRC